MEISLKHINNKSYEQIVYNGLLELLDSISSFSDKATKCKIEEHLLKEPDIMKRLLNPGARLVFPYLLHAIVGFMFLTDKKHNEILNDMTDENIKKLKQLIEEELNKPCPNKECLEERKKEHLKKTTKKGLIELSIEATINVHDNWDEIRRHMSSWIDSINSFKRETKSIEPEIEPETEPEIETEQKIETKKKNMKEWLTMEELAKILQIKVNSIYRAKYVARKKSDAYKARIDSMFKERLFNSKYLNEFAQLCSLKFAKNLSANTTKVKATQEKQETKKTLLDFKALEAFVNGLVAEIQAAKRVVEAKEKEYNEKFKQLEKATNSIQRTELLQQINEANNEVTKATKKYDEAKTKQEQANELYNTMMSAYKKLVALQSENRK